LEDLEKRRVTISARQVPGLEGPLSQRISRFLSDLIGFGAKPSMASVAYRRQADHI
jgi:hypothetical protein